MFVDDIDVFDNSNRKFLNKWRQILSHVPQDIFISDSSFAENIAFGFHLMKLILKIKMVSKQAQLDNLLRDYQKYLTFWEKVAQN